MYTSGTEPTARTAVKTALVYLLLSLFCVLFGAVYELFSHGVYSFSMIYAFVFPLAGGALPFLLLGFCKMKKYPGSAARHLYHSGIAALTVGSIMQGILDIYGTTNALIRIYWLAGIALLTAGVVAYLLSLFEKQKR